MAAHHFFLDFMQLTFSNWEKCGLILKPFLVIELWTMLQDWLRFLFLTSIFQQNPINAISLVGVLVILQMIVVLVFDKIVLSHRPELQSPTHICMLYPIYNILTVLFRFVGLLYNTLYYTPWNPPRILIKDRKRLGMIPPAVAEPMGDPAEREAYWRTVWKLDTYTKSVPPPVSDTVISAVAAVAQAILVRQDEQKGTTAQPEVPATENVYIDITGETGAPERSDEIKPDEVKADAESTADVESIVDDVTNSMGFEKFQQFGSIRKSNSFTRSDQDLTPRGGNKRVRWDDTESCDSFVDALRLDANFNPHLTIGVST